MINELPEVSTVLTSFLFADDISGLAKGKNFTVLIEKINIELKKWSL